MVHVLIVLFVLYAVLFVYKTKTGSPYLPSKEKDIERMLKYVKRGSVVCDMGAGDGRLLKAAIKKGAKEAWGWEIEPLVWFIGNLRVKKEEKKIERKTHLMLGDMWKVNLAKFDVVFVYQLERFADKFAIKCKREMKPGSIVVANTYPIKKLNLWKKDGEIFVYRI